MAVQESVCHTSQPPEGFSNVVWENICKTPCSDVLMCWLSQQLVDQDMGEICDALSIDKTDSLKASSGSGWKIRDVLSAWLGKRGGAQTTYLSELVLPLSALHIKNLDADTLNEKAIELGGQCSGFEYDGASKPVKVRSDSGVEESILKPLGSYPPAPIECTDQGDGYDGLFALPIQEEETSIRILSELVTGGMQHFKHSSHKPSYIIDRQKIRALRVELRDWQNEFASHLQHVCDDLEATDKKLRVFLTQRCVDTHNKIPHFPTFMIEIINMSTFEEVFAHLSRIGAWHFLSYLILKDIFVLFQNITPELRSQLDEYNTKIEGFKQRTLLMDFLAVWGGRYDKDEDLPCSRSVIVKSIGDPFSFTIADACDKAGLIAGEFSLKELGILADGSVQKSVCYTSQPPEGFSDVEWENICKTPCSDVLMCWLSQQLVDQDMGEICDALSIDKTDSPKAGSDWKIRDVLSAWLGKRGGANTTYLSELVLPLSALHIKNLDANTLNEIAIELGGQCSDFKYDGASLPVGMRSDSGIDESTSRPLGSYPPAPIECTDQGDGYDGLFALPIQEEETSMRILSEPVTGGMQHFKHSSHKPSYKIDRQKIRALRIELRYLQNEFASLLQHVCDELGQNEATVKKLRVFLTQRSTFEEVFAHLSLIGAWHFLSYLILKDMFVLFQNITPELRSQFDEYNTKTEGFKQRTLLMDFLAVWGGRYDKDEDLPCSRSVIVKSIGDPFSFTIADACDKAGLIAGEFSLKDLGILADGSTGSIYIKWLVSPAAAKHILEVMKSEKRPDLLQFGVLQLAVKRTVFKSKYWYESIYKLSLNNPRLFWGGVGAMELVWRKHSREVFTYNKETGEFHWFRGAQLNVSENCLDEHVKYHPDKVALIWERDDEKTERVTYKQLLDQTCRVANVLKKRGINKGDVVVICMPTMPLAVASMLACARIGAVHCVVFSDFNEDVLRQQIKEVNAKAVVTADIRVIGGMTRNLKEKIVRTLSSVDTSVEFVLVAKRNDTSSEAAKDTTTDSDGFYFLMEQEMREVPPDCDPVPMDGEDILFIAYTSGTQMGASKAVYHTQAGYLLYTKLTYKFMFNLAPDDIMGCVSDLGWIAAHCYVVYGPLSNGNTTLLFESTATYPDEGRYWKVIDKLKLTHFYTISSVINELMIKDNKGAGQINNYDLSSLKVITVGGEPIPQDVEKWYYTMIGKGKCLFLDTWEQTEIGGTGIVRWEAPQNKKRADFPLSKSFALFGLEWVQDEKRKEVFDLYLKQPLPGMAKFVLDSVKKSYEQQHYSKEIGGYSTNSKMEYKGSDKFRVLGRKEGAHLIQGVRSPLTDIEYQLGMIHHTGTDTYDAPFTTFQKPEAKQGYSLSKTKNSSTDLAFVKPVNLVCVTCDGFFYHDNALGLTIDIPKGAVQDKLTLEVGMLLHGPFQFPSRQISPIVMLRPVTIPADLLSPIKITLPHIIIDETVSDMDKLCVKLMKANHITLDHDGQYIFSDITAADDNVFFHICDGKGYATISLTHFCFLTLRLDAEKRSYAYKVGCCVCPFFPSQKDVLSRKFHFQLGVTYYMDVFIEAIQKQYSVSGRKLCERMITPFKFNSTDDYIQARVIKEENTATKGWVVGLLHADAEEKEVIKHEAVDLWRKEEEQLKLDIKSFQYPPLFQIDVLGSKATCDSFVQLQFVTKEETFYLKLPLEWYESVHATSNTGVNYGASTTAHAGNLSELINQFGIKDADLDNEVCDDFLLRISSDSLIDNWNPYARQFGLSEQDIANIEQHIGLTTFDRVYKTFGKWKSSNITRATYKTFIRTLLNYSHFGLARNVCKLLKNNPDVMFQ